MITKLELRHIEARRFAKSFEPPVSGGQVRIDHNSTVTLMDEMATDQAYVEFAYTTTYGAVGMIKVDGALIYEDAGAGELVAQWKETRKMPNETASKIHSTVMHACVPEAVGLAKTLRLPPPIPLPQVRFQQQGAATSTAPSGPEFA